MRKWGRGNVTVFHVNFLNLQFVPLCLSTCAVCFLGTQREEKTRGLVTLLFEVNLCGFYKGNEKLQASIALSRGKNDVTNDVAARGFYFFVRCCGFGSLCMKTLRV